MSQSERLGSSVSQSERLGSSVSQSERLFIDGRSSSACVEGRARQ